MREKHHILLVEDDPADIFLAEEIFGDYGGFELAVVSSGTEAISFLRDNLDNPPDLVLLDLNIPGLDGRDVLRETKSDAVLKEIPIIVMSTSDAPDDIHTSYKLGANSFITKPVGIEEFEGMVKALELFWFRLAKLPSRA